MLTFLLQTLDLIQLVLTHPIRIAIYGRDKASRIRSQEIDRILNVR
jgi:hypothetical protein